MLKSNRRSAWAVASLILSGSSILLFGLVVSSQQLKNLSLLFVSGIVASVCAYISALWPRMRHVNIPSSFLMRGAFAVSIIIVVWYAIFACIIVVSLISTGPQS